MFETGRLFAKHADGSAARDHVLQYATGTLLRKGENWV